MREPHPLCAECPREYWRSADGMERARGRVLAAAAALTDALAAGLDRLHRQPEGRDYWRMLLRPFLLPLTGYLFDRASDAPRAGPVPRLEPSMALYSARDFINHVIGRTPLCDLLDAAIADALHDASWRGLRAAAPVLELAPRTRGGEPWTGRVRSALFFWEGVGPVTHYSAPFSTMESLRLGLASRGRVRRGRFPERVAAPAYSGRRRAELLGHCEAAPPGDALARFALVPAALLLPSAFVEHYAEVLEWRARAERTRPRVIATGLGYDRSPAFGAFAAQARAQGAEIVGIQHGGFYGQTQPNWYELLEHEQSDLYCTWGYRFRERDRPMPSVRLAHLPRGGARGGRAVLWTLSATLHTAFAIAATPHYRRHEELGARYLEAAVQASGPLALPGTVRPHPRSRDTPLVRAWQERLPGFTVDPGGGRSLIEHARAHGLVAFDFAGATGFLECLTAGVPAVIFSPEDLVPIRPEARPHFDALRSVGVYTTEPGELAATLKAFAGGGDGWWAEPRRAQAVARFRDTFALTVPDTLGAWAGFFRERLDYNAARIPASAPRHTGAPPT